MVGYYNRFDIFKLTVDRSANRPITFEFENDDHEEVTASPAAAQEDHNRDEIPQIVRL